MVSLQFGLADFYDRKNIQLLYQKYILFNLEKRQYFQHYWSDKVFMGTVVNWSLPSLHGGSLQIARTVEKNGKKKCCL